MFGVLKTLLLGTECGENDSKDVEQIFRRVIALKNYEILFDAI